LKAALAGPDCIAIDCRFDLMRSHAGFQAYLAGHVQGARYAHLDLDLARRPALNEGRHPLPTVAEFLACLQDWGIETSDSVVVYDDVGGAVAARLWWMLRWLGHRRAHLLDGGFAAWQAVGGQVEQDLPLWTPSNYAANAAQDAWLIESREMTAAMAAGAVLLDARSPARFRGEAEPIDPVAGHVPGANNLPFTELLDRDGLFKTPAVLREIFASRLGPAASSDSIAMCGSGVTACHLLAGMAVAGLEPGRLYAGSWSEWIRDPGRAVAIRATD
jgi:thiosulfate/3-mercaptopyruvate sulfurtransferase